MGYGNLISLNLVAPEVILAGAALCVFLTAAFYRREARWPSWVLPGAAMVGLLAALLVLLLSVWKQYQPGGGNCLEGSFCLLFQGALASDPLSNFFRALILFSCAVAVLLSLGSPALPPGRRGEFFGLLLTMAVGMCLLTGANHLLIIYLGLETVSLMSYLLTGFDPRSPRSAEAGLKYMLYGGVASAVMLFGLSLLYGLFGNLNLQSLQFAILGSPMLDGEAGRWAALLAVIFVLTGIGFKIAAVPFHHWCPDAYEGAPTPFTALLSVAPKIAGFALLLRLFYGMFLFPRSYDHFLPESGQIPWVLVLMVLSALTMTLGNLAAILQNNLKRLLAYSSIAHAGYLLMGVVAGGTEGFSSVTLYAGVYVLMNLGAFSVVVAVEGATGSEDLKDWKGLGRKAPLLALCMAVFLFSLVGLPPTAGFVGKLYLFAALLKHGGDWFVVLAVVGIVNSVVSLYYYARVLKAMYLEAPGQVESGAAGRSLAAGVAFALAVPVLILGVFWQPLALVAEWSARFLH